MASGASIADSIKAISLKTPIASMAGIGPKRAEALNNKGIRTVEDLLFHLPARYQDCHPTFRCACMYAFSTAFIRD
jgi:ATP-dependent DNA helicase RecG